MSHEVALISTIAIGLTAAFFGGLIAMRLRFPPAVGYLLAGIVVGPFTPGIVADTHTVNELAELGVVLLMLGVGLHFSMRDLLAVRRIAIPGAAVQIIAATALGVLTARMWGWSFGAGIVFGLALSVASTVVLMRALETRDGPHALATPDARVAVGWLIVEDLVVVLVLVLLPAFAGALGGTAPAGSDSALMTGLATLVKVAAFVAVMLVIGARLLPRLLDYTDKLASPELFSLAVAAVTIGVAVGAAKLFGVSLSLGAFFAGMLIGESRHKKRVTTELLPLQNTFSALFFVGVGMLFDPMTLLHEPVKVLIVVAIIILGKSIVAFGLVRGFGYPTRTAVTVAAGLAQIGEFSFILAQIGVTLGIFPQAGQQLILAGALLSILLNPLLFRLTPPTPPSAREAAPHHA